MSVTPYIGLAEITADKAGTAKGLVAEFIGTLLLVGQYFRFILLYLK